jgi:23S rRNA (uracil1939-C5)-methyltransferase
MSHGKIQFGRPKKSKVKQTELLLQIDNLSLEGRGVAKHLGKTIFVEGAIPQEQVNVKITKRHKSFDEACVVSIESASSQRITAQCDHFGHCGGCQLQHIAPQAQLDYKQQAVLSLLEHNAKTTPVQIDSPLISDSFYYRRSARIGVNRLTQSNASIVGFRRKNSSKLLQVSHCIVLPKNLEPLFDQLRECLEKIDNAKSITHIEYLQGDTYGALTFRAKADLAKNSRILLINLLQPFQLIGYIRYDHALVPLDEGYQVKQTDLSYKVNDLQLCFKPGDFLQVNAQINQQMIDRAVHWLTLSNQDCILDLFSGLGNFSLPIARQVKSLIAVEGSEEMVKRASDNAQLNQIDNCQFYRADLSKNNNQAAWLKQSINKIIIDPPRSGASELIKQLFQSQLEATALITHILYVACDPSSLARDSKLLKECGYKMDKFCVMDMFPNTTHIESMALFIKDDSIKAKPVMKKSKNKAAAPKRLIKF